MEDIKNYRFLVPFDNSARKWLEKNMGEAYESSDGNPELSEDFEEGWLVTVNEYNSIPEDVVDNVSVFKLSKRFGSKSEFLTDYLDGDIQDNDFIYIQ